MTTKLTKDNIDNLKNFAVSWQSVITADGSTTTSLEAGKGYFIDTTSNTHTVVLPTNASIGDIVRIKDYAGTFGSNALTINRNGHNIQGSANNSEISTNRASISLFYVDSTKGWLFSNESNVGDLQSPFITATGGTISTIGDYKYHVFTGDGCFVVSEVGSPLAPTDNTTVQTLVVAGGAGGGVGSINATVAGSGGGAGGLRNISGISVTTTTYPITVGAGGGGVDQPTVSTPDSFGCSGSPSVFSTITSAGGGGGGSRYVGPGPQDGIPGGSGGGSGYAPTPLGGAGDGGFGNTPPVSPPQGNDGEDCGSAGGGGSFKAAGVKGGEPFRGIGGAGTDVSSDFPGPLGGFPAPTGGTYAGGGGGGGRPNAPEGAGGTGGGGPGGAVGPAPCVSNRGKNAAVNTGSGGGGAGASTVASGFTPYDAGNGGKGIVIIKYKYQ